jgi:hypothetical protein
MRGVKQKIRIPKAKTGDRIGSRGLPTACRRCKSASLLALLSHLSNRLRGVERSLESTARKKSSSSFRQPSSKLSHGSDSLMMGGAFSVCKPRRSGQVVECESRLFFQFSKPPSNLCPLHSTLQCS